MTKDEVLYSLRFKNTPYFSPSEYSSIIKNERDFIFKDINFKWIDNQYIAIIDNVEYSDLKDLVVNNTNLYDIDEYIYCHYNINDIIYKNDIQKILEIAELSGGSLYLYDIEMKIYRYENICDEDYYRAIKSAVENEIPFRFHYSSQFNNKTVIIHANNINGVYTLHDPYSRITDDDINKIKKYNLMNII